MKILIEVRIVGSEYLNWQFVSFRFVARPLTASKRPPAARHTEPVKKPRAIVETGCVNACGSLRTIESRSERRKKFQEMQHPCIGIRHLSFRQTPGVIGGIGEIAAEEVG